MTKRCRRCLLPEFEPQISLNEEGICSICEEYEDKDSNNASNALLESKLYEIIEEYRGEGKYDCLVMCSGGKDSTSALYYMKKKYDLNPIAFTFDNGFETERALKNVRNAVEALDVEWVLFKSEYMREAFKEIIQKYNKASICQVCSMWYIMLTHDIADRFDTPLIVAGWTDVQSISPDEDDREYIPFTKATEDFVLKLRKKYERYEDFPRNMGEAMKKARQKIESKIISPHWFFPEDPEDIVPTLKEELDWEKPDKSYPKGSTNCLLNFVSSYLMNKNFGYTHYHVEQSKLIRKGKILRQEAENKLEMDFDREFLNSILERINCKLPEE